MGERDSEEENEGEGGSADRWCMGEREEEKRLFTCEKMSSLFTMASPPTDTAITAGAMASNRVARRRYRGLIFHVTKPSMMIWPGRGKGCGGGRGWRCGGVEGRVCVGEGEAQREGVGGGR